jgi:maltokinase
VRRAVRRRFAAIEADAGVTLQRIHGDYHLGQLLHTEGGFAVIDFEGEPARPLAERRMPASPLRDVAGMLRSLDYAVRTVERDGPDGFDHQGWLANARAAFVAAYGGEAVAHEGLLTAFEAAKACYEVRYEASNRPDWTWLPLEALERLAP